MMMKSDSLARCGAIATLLLMAGCALPDDTRGTVLDITDNTVKIRGAFSMDGTLAHPTPAMVQQAKDICPGAQYVSANPYSNSDDDMTFVYLFRCK